jgi:hypothetical protein
MSDDWESSGDEWEESSYGGTTLVQMVPTVTWTTLNTFVYQNKDYKYYNGLACTLPLVNFGITSDARKVIHRCEPLKDPTTGLKNYPTVTLPPEMKAYSHVLLTMVLFHPNCGHVRVRFPDLKDKVEQHRSEQGLWINTNDGPFRMKKKAVDKGTKEDVGYRLGADFKFHTPGIEPTFVMVATPCDVSGLLMDKAVRSEHFLVRSKRQEQPGPRKRRKKAKEISKLETDIAAARNEKQLLQREDMRLNYVNTKHGGFLRYLQKKLETSLKDTTVGIALQHAVRPVTVDETVAL